MLYLFIPEELVDKGYPEVSVPKQRTTLSLEETAIERGRRYNQRHGISLSRLVNDFLFLIQLPGDQHPLPLPPSPVVRRLLGIAARGPDEGAYHHHLMEKHGR